MSVTLDKGFAVSGQWLETAKHIHARLRDAGCHNWNIALRRAESEASPSAEPSEGALLIEVDVPGRHIEVAVPDSATALSADDFGQLLLDLISEAEDETETEYGPTDEDDH